MREDSSFVRGFAKEGNCWKRSDALQQIQATEGAFETAVSLDEASRWLTSRLNGGIQRWTLGGTAIDIATARSAVRLTAELKGSLEGGGTKSGDAFLESVERQGMVGATFGELTQRVDTLFFIGDVFRDLPRLGSAWLERFSTSYPSQERRCVFLAPASQWTEIERSMEASSLQGYFVDIGTPPVHRWLAELRARIAGRLPANPRSSVDEVLGWIERSHSSAWLWSSDALSLPAASVLIELVSDLNKTRRSMLIPFADDITFRNVASWLTGIGLPIDFYTGLPKRVDRRIGLNPELRIWLMPHPLAAAPPNEDCELVIVGMPTEEVRRRASIWVRAAVPGIEAAGTTLRGDGAVGLALRAQRTRDGIPTADEILDSWTHQVVDVRGLVC